MTSENFAYWLQGFFELTDEKVLTERQVGLIKSHLNLVFKHDIDPKMGDEKKQLELNKIHNLVTEDDAIKLFGPKPSPNHSFNIHGWYNPKEGVPRC